MDIIKDNIFSVDSNNTRLERLIAIEGNFDKIQTELQSPDYIVEWALNCNSIYLNLIGEASSYDGISIGCTKVIIDKESEMMAIYQKIKLISKVIYRDDLAIYESFKFNISLPIPRNDKLARVNLILNLYADLVDKSYPILIPNEYIVALETARNEFNNAIANQEVAKGQSHFSNSVLRNRFNSDTKMLQDLRTFWFLKFGKNDPRITLIGMVNPKKVGKKKKKEN